MARTVVQRADEDYLVSDRFSVNPPVTSVAQRQLLYLVKKRLHEEGMKGVLRIETPSGYRSNVQIEPYSLLTYVMWHVMTMSGGGMMTIRWDNVKIQFKCPDLRIKVAINGFRCPFKLDALRKLLLTAEERRGYDPANCSQRKDA